MVLNISLIYGSVRQKRQGIRVVKFLKNELEKRGHNVFFIDPREYNLPLLDKTFKEYKKDEAPEKLKDLSKKLNLSDGFIIISGEYNHSIPAALKNILDYFKSEYSFKPSAIVSYSIGDFGGVRAAMALRTILPELGMSSIPSTFPIPKVQENFDDTGKALNNIFLENIERFLGEFEWYVKALKQARDKGTSY